MRAISSITSISRVTSRKRVVGHAHVDRALSGARIEAEAVEDLDRSRERHLERRDVRDALHAHAQRRARRQVAADVDRARRHARAADLDEQPRGGARGDRRQVRVDALLPAVRGLRAQAERLRCAQDLSAREVGRLEHDRRRALADLGVGAAHDAGDALTAPSASAITSIDGSSARSCPSSVRSVSPARARRARQACAAHARVVVGVHRAAEVVHDVVRDVDDVRDRAHARGAAAAPSARAARGRR